MKQKQRIPTLVTVLLLAVIMAGCGSQNQPTQAPTTAAVETFTETATADSPDDLPTLPAEEAATECPGEEINPLGESIAADYEFATYDQVMSWFCEGAAFEDILAALETQALTDEPAGEMLQMLADGLTWEEIWLLVGLED